MVSGAARAAVAQKIESFQWAGDYYGTLHREPRLCGVVAASSTVEVWRPKVYSWSSIPAGVSHGVDAGPKKSIPGEAVEAVEESVR